MKDLSEKKDRSFSVILMTALLVGIVIGVMCSASLIYLYQDYRIKEAVTLGGFVYDHNVYQINKRTAVVS